MCADSFDKVYMNVATFVSAASMDMLLHDVSSTAVDIDSSIIVNVGRAVLYYQNILDKAILTFTWKQSLDKALVNKNLELLIIYLQQELQHNVYTTLRMSMQQVLTMSCFIGYFAY